MPAAYAGSSYPAVEPLDRPAPEPAAMPSPPCARVMTYVSESPLGVAYRSLAVLADGSIAAPLWYEHATGAWSPTFEAPKHVREMFRDPTFAALQCYAAPAGVADDPSITADVFILKPDRSVASVYDSRSANEVSAISRGWYSKP